MAGNYLEQLIAEWYEYKGYFLRRNVLVDKRKNGGYDCELDIVGFHPKNKHLVHIEPSMDADSWAERERRYLKKFEAGRRNIPLLFEGFDLPDEIHQIAVFPSASNRDLAGGKVMLISELIAGIIQTLPSKSIYTNIVPEHLPILRTFQFASVFRDEIMAVWSQQP
jgi:hypothetical protein